MGCTGSKHFRGRSPSPYGRSHSLPLHYGGGDARHAVALTSSTLGSLVLDRCESSSDDEAVMESTDDRPQAPEAAAAGSDLLTKELVRANTWSEMIERRILRTPTTTPPNEPEVIDTWELMAGLEDASAISLSLATAVHSSSSSSLRTSSDGRRSSPDTELSSACSSPKPQPMLLGPVDPVVTDFDPEILSSFRKALDELSPQHQSYSISRPLGTQSAQQSIEECREIPNSISIVRVRINEFQQKIDSKKTSSNANSAKILSPAYKCPPGGEGKVVFYFTSLRGIRRTYEDCWATRVILKGYGVRIDERDVSMHAGFKRELIGMLGPAYGGNRLPRVFADGNNYLGGAEEVRHLHETGRLGRFLECCEPMPMGKGGGVDGHGSCEGCGDVGFVPCERCSGSCKVYVEEEEEEEAKGSAMGGFRRCPDCNENGLVRCPLCCC